MACASNRLLRIRVLLLQMVLRCHYSRGVSFISFLWHLSSHNSSDYLVCPCHLSSIMIQTRPRQCLRGIVRAYVSRCEPSSFPPKKVLSHCIYCFCRFVCTVHWPPSFFRFHQHYTYCFVFSSWPWLCSVHAFAFFRFLFPLWPLNSLPFGFPLHGFHFSLSFFLIFVFCLRLGSACTMVFQTKRSDLFVFYHEFLVLCTELFDFSSQKVRPFCILSWVCCFVYETNGFFLGGWLLYSSTKRKQKLLPFCS